MVYLIHIFQLKIITANIIITDDTSGAKDEICKLLSIANTFDYKIHVTAIYLVSK